VALLVQNIHAGQGQSGAISSKHAPVRPVRAGLLDGARCAQRGGHSVEGFVAGLSS